MEQTDTIKPNNKPKFIPFVVQIILIYILFAISIIVSISYTEWTVFHHLTFNSYIWNKILIESLKNTFFAVIVSTLITYGLHYFRQIKIVESIEDTVEGTTSSNNFISENNIVVAISTFLIFACTSLPLYTIISTFYVGNDGTFFELNFVHFTSFIKIIISSILIIATFLILKLKYKYIFRDLFTVICILALLATRGVFLTKSKNFDTEETKLLSIYNSNEQFELNGSIDKVILDKVDPLANNLLKMASTNDELSDAYYWMARIKEDEGNSDQAIKYINLSAYYQPNLQREYYVRSYVSYGKGNFDESKQEALKCQDMTECVMRVAYLYAIDNNFKLTKEYLQKAYDMDPEQIYVKKYLEYYSSTKIPVERINYITLLNGTKPVEKEFDQCLTPNLIAYKKEFDALCIQSGKSSNCTSVNLWDAETINANLNKEMIACHVIYIKKLDAKIKH